jgi:serine/threonine protein kinase
MLTGGRLLDTGTYSCVFDPPLKCRSKTRPKGVKKHSNERMISKLMMDEEAEVEWAISEKIRKIPLWKNYFSVSETMCHLDPKQTEPDLKTKCEVIKNIAPEQLRVLQMPFAGKPIYNHRIPTNFNLLTFITHILEGGALLLLGNIIHFDLHPGNILIDNHQTPRIIDFNLSMVSDVSIPESQLSYRYSRNFHLPQQPPDYTAVIGINQHKEIGRIVRNIEEKKIIKDIKVLLNIPRDTVINEILQISNKNSFISRGDILGWFYKYWTKIDSWAFGTYFVDMLTIHSITPQIGNALRKYPKIKRVLRGLCEVDPEKRWDSIQALYYLNPDSLIIKKYGRQWLEHHGYPKA